MADTMNPEQQVDPASPEKPAIPANPSKPAVPPSPEVPALAAAPPSPTAAATQPGPTVSAAPSSPGLVTFAAIVMLVLAGFHVVFAIDEFTSAIWVAANVYGTYGGPLWLWGIIDLAFAAAAIYAGYDLLRGGSFGRIFGLMVASFSAVRWFFYLPAAPLLAMVVIAVDILIIYGLAVHSEYFLAGGATRRRASV